MASIATILVKQSRLDARALSAFIEELDRALASDPSALVIDLSSVEYIDSLGIGVLAITKRRAGARPVALAGLGPFVANVVRAAHLADKFDIIPSADAARAVLAV